MNVIDHAILIPASPAFIWRFLGDISQNTEWQNDCATISFLTTQREGRGTRWRYTNAKGKDVVIEITAWYDTLGYEYIVVDGGSVGENKGRIRLQEIAEGTLVQWTFNYELDGMFSSLRNSMGLKRSLTNNIQDSLRNLYKYVQNETGGITTHEAKALLKEAPDVEERSSYQPRHPSNFKEDAIDESFAEPEYPSEKPITYDYRTEPLIEPPIADDDTKPNPIVQGTEEIPVVADTEEPESMQGIPDQPVVDDDTKPNAPILDEEVASTSSSESEIVQFTKATSTDEETVSDVATPDIRDTSTVSVFELFGLQKPSETQEMAAISDEELAGADVESIVPTPPAADMIARDDVDESTEADVDTISDPETPLDTGSIVEVEATEENTLEPETTPDTSSVPTSLMNESDLDNPDQSTIVESETLNIIEPDATTSNRELTGLRSSLRHKLTQLRTRR